MIDRRLVLDTDVGIDDALMVLMLLAEPEVEIVAIGSSHGNCTAAEAAINTLRVLDAVGVNNIPVALGLESPLPIPHKASWVHGHDGLADTDLPAPKRTISGESAPDQLIRLGKQFPGELDLIAVGPLTNLAAALASDPQSLHRFRSITWLGGVSRRPVPTDEYFDANALSDPEAAHAIFISDAPITVIPIDLSYRAVLEDRHLTAIRTGTTPQAKTAWKILPFYNDFYETRFGRWTSCMHDPIAGAIAIHPELIIHETQRSIVLEPFEGRIHAHGQMEPVAGHPPKRIIDDAGIPHFLDVFVESLLRPLNPIYQTSE